MSSDLKQELLDTLQVLTMRSSVPALTYDEVYALSARLQRATVTEPKPTDAELRERLQAALPEGWDVSVIRGDGSFCARLNVGARSFAAYPYATTLRKPGGIEACARALKVLAGMEDK